MKTSQTKTGGVCGFTLIELLIVIAIIAILAGLLLPVAGKIKQNMALKRAQAELSNVQTAISSYKTKMGHYPPDYQNNVARNPLYYELVGCNSSINGAVITFTPLDGGPAITSLQLSAAFPLGTFPAVVGIVNSGAGSGSDEGGAAQPFLKELKPNQYAVTAGVRVLGVQVPGSSGVMVGDLNPFCYNSSSPTNNTDSYDLWVDVVFGRKTNRINNWGPTIINP